VIILTEADRKTCVAMSEFCRKNKILFILADIRGVFTRIFCDFGNEFVVADKNGDPPQECLIKSISNDKDGGVIKLMDTSKHNLEDGDEIEISEVDGMNVITSSTENPEEEKSAEKSMD